MLLNELVECLRQIRLRGHRAVVVVPDPSYEDILSEWVACVREPCSGRSFRLPEGALVTLWSVRSSPAEAGTAPYHLYCVGWRGARPTDMEPLRAWVAGAREVYGSYGHREISRTN